ncbi:MAG: hypothetical protein ACJ8F3_17495 [Xanthobacteraceae bacterium]
MPLNLSAAAGDYDERVSVMTRVGNRPVTTPTRSASLGTELADAVRTLWRGLLDPYRPELHYMRGPGPKWRAKHLGHSRHAGWTVARGTVALAGR